VRQDLDAILKGWEFEPGNIQARLVRARDGRQVLQMRVDLGILQLESAGRPDGARPHGAPTYFDYLRRLARGNKDFELDEEQCQEADREFTQFYHRRVCWLTLRNFDKALADADHTLAFMDFVRDHGPNEEYVQAHEQFRGFVLWHRTQAAAALAIERDDPEAAIDAIHKGIDQLRDFFAAFGAEDQMDEHGMVQRLREMDQALRQAHNIKATLRERLADAVAREDYETAARLRDALKRRQ
jgi:hypothetical protein